MGHSDLVVVEPPGEAVLVEALVAEFPGELFTADRRHTAHSAGAPITLERAEAAINAAVAEAKKRNRKMNVAVVDSSGNLVAFQRMDGAQLASIQVAEHKARAAATFRRETKVWEDAMASLRLHVAYLAPSSEVVRVLLIGPRAGEPHSRGRSPPRFRRGGRRGQPA